MLFDGYFYDSPQCSKYALIQWSWRLLAFVEWAFLMCDGRIESYALPITDGSPIYIRMNTSVLHLRCRHSVYAVLWINTFFKALAYFFLKH